MVAVSYLKFKQRGQTLGYFVKMVQKGITNREDPDQTAPLGAVWSGSALFAQTYMSENLGSLRYGQNDFASGHANRHVLTKTGIMSLVMNNIDSGYWKYIYYNKIHFYIFDVNIRVNVHFHFNVSFVHSHLYLNKHYHGSCFRSRKRLNMIQHLIVCIHVTAYLHIKWFYHTSLNMFMQTHCHQSSQAH